MEKTNAPLGPQSQSLESEGQESKSPPQFKLAASGAAAAGDDKPAQKKDDPFKVDAGQITFDVEGAEGGKYHSRVVHWPGGVSGVTIGRGYDMGSRSAQQIAGHMQAAGITGQQASTLCQAAKLTGKPAGDWVAANKAKVGEITPEQQEALFNIVYAEMKKSVVDISERETTSKGAGAKTVYGDVDFDKLHPAIMDMIVDLRYRGDYHSESRKVVQPLMVKNDLKGLAKVMADRSLWKTVPEDRFNRRKKYMEDAVAGKQQPATLKDNKKEETAAKPAAPAAPATPIGKAKVTATKLNVRSLPNGEAKIVGGLFKDAEITIIAESDGWAKIGPDQWVSCKFIQKLGGAPKGPEVKPANPAAPAADSGGKPNWISIAEGEVGVKEIEGAKHSERVIEYHSTTGKFKDDETPWCSSFVNWVMGKAGKARTGSAGAMSWAGYGKKLDKPAYGAIAVFSYGGGKGHVGFIVGKQGAKLQILGGNQGNMVKVSSFGTSQIAAYVVPSDYTVPASAYNLGQNGTAEDSGGLAGTR